PEDLVLRPATPYVAEFTRDVPKAKVLRVAAIMSADLATSVGGEVPADARVVAVAARLREAGAPLAVVDSGGRRIGTLTRDAVADVMLGG
ncbi:MAG: glycine betaine/L-proline ABC transporter ATP-binding protein, partial [Rhizobiales bacterium]|nr:glycine betaine/L-proline ABC transporter ATP-binding protein [Hyphomicrobiales bacterium]